MILFFAHITNQTQPLIITDIRYVYILIAIKKSLIALKLPHCWPSVYNFYLITFSIKTRI
jgi:hypothetical protein